MKKVALIISLALVVCVFLSSQDYKGKGRIFGVVFDEAGKPLEGVRVKLAYAKSNEGFEVKTDNEGKWTGAWLRGGSWNIDFEKIGFETKKIVFEVSENEKKPEIKINLKKAAGLVLSDELKTKLTQANQMFEQKNYQAALEAYKDLLEKFPEAYILWKNVGHCYFAQEQYDQAEESYKKILEKNADDSDAILLVGNCYSNRGQTDKAMEWYNKIQFDKITDPIVLYNIGNNYYKISKFEEALRHYQRSVELQKDFLDGLYQLGLAYTTLQKNQEAIATFETFLKYDSTSDKATQVRTFLDYLKKK
jgi:tetratricopeptide (TPR) repeat protein